MFCFSTKSHLKLGKFLRKIRTVFREINSQLYRFWQSIKSLKKFFVQKTLKQHLFVDFSKIFASIHGAKMEQILLAYGLPKETVTAIMMLYRNNNKNFLTWWRHRLLQHCYWSFARRYTDTIFVYNLPTLRILNVDKSNKTNGFTPKKGKKMMISCRNYNSQKHWLGYECK